MSYEQGIEKAVTYPFRLVWNRLWFYGLTCRAKWCAKRTVGVSVWCQKHTDEILERVTP